MNLTSNPWSFVTADVVNLAITSVTLNSDGTVTLVCASTTAFLPGGGVTLINTTAASGVYNGFYEVISGATTTYKLAPQKVIPAGTGAGGVAGQALLCQYSANVRIEDLSWQNVPISATLDIRDRNGNILWQASTAATYVSGGAQNRGKLFWVHGISLAVLTTPSIVIVTVN